MKCLQHVVESRFLFREFALFDSDLYHAYLHGECLFYVEGNADVRMFGVVEPVGWENVVDTLSLQLIHFHSQTHIPDAC